MGSKNKSKSNRPKPAPNWEFIDLQLDGDLGNVTSAHAFDAIGLSEARQCHLRYAMPEEGDRDSGSPENDNGKFVDKVKGKGKGKAAPSEETPKCNKKWCVGNLLCRNHVGAEEWFAKDAIDKFFSVQGLGGDPADDARKDGIPTGLRNLGATCYANAFLQVWYQTMPIREGVYACAEKMAGPASSASSLKSSPLYQLALTFASLQYSEQQVYDPTGLVEALMLEKGNQQDASEFSKLFMSLLADEFQKQDDPKLKTLVADQFEGQLQYKTKCLSCGNASGRNESFLELEVSLDTTDCALAERLQHLMSPERLEGDNQYYCSNCDGLRDAERTTSLESLPPILHFSLLRFVYDPKTSSRKKSKTSIRFPPRIEMGRYMSGGDDASRSADYELRGVVEHIGVSAHHGHFVCKVYNLEKKRWFLCNDEECQQIRTMSFLPSATPNGKGNEGSDSAIVVGSASPNPRTKAGDLMDVDDDDDPIALIDSKLKINSKAKKEDPTPQPKLKRADILTPPLTHSSSNVYMLVYKRRDPTVDDTDATVSQPSGDIKQRVDEMNKQFKEKTSTFRKRENDLREAFQKIRSTKWDALQLDHTSTTNGYFVDKKHLEKWIGKGLQRSIKINVNNAIGSGSSAALEDPNSTEKNGAGNTGPEDTQMTDAQEPVTASVPVEGPSVDSAVLAADIADVKAVDGGGNRTKEQADNGPDDDQEPQDVPEIPNTEEAGVILSTEECIRKILHDFNFDNSALSCEHNRLDHEKAHKARLISNASYQTLMSLGCTFDPVLPVKDACCRTCLEKGILSRLQGSSLKEQIEEYKNRLELGSDEDVDHFISRKWLNAWMDAATKERLFEDDFLQECNLELVCEHNYPKRSKKSVAEEAIMYLTKLFPGYSVPFVEVPRGSECEKCAIIRKEKEALNASLQPTVLEEKSKLMSLFKRKLSSTTSQRYGLTHYVVPPQFLDDWRSYVNDPADHERPKLDNTAFLCEHGKLNIDPTFNPDMTSGVTCVMEETTWENLTHFYAAPETVISFSRLSVTELSCSVDTCKPCWQARLSELPYDVTVTLLHDEDPNTGPVIALDDSASEGSVTDTPNKHNKRENAGPTGSRKSARVQDMSTRRTPSRRRKSFLINVSSTDTLMDLKQAAAKKFKATPFLLRIFLRGIELDENAFTLEKLGVRPQDVVFFREYKTPDDDEIQCLGEFDEPTKPTKEVGRGGFGGTLLHGRVSPVKHSETSAGSSADTSAKSSEGKEPEVVPGADDYMDIDDSGMACPDCTFVNPITSQGCEVCHKVFFQ